jgi:hypothetical protein
MPEQIKMWIYETDQYGPTSKKFSVENPVFIPRVGETISNMDADVFGIVDIVQYEYFDLGKYKVVINIFLKEKQ